jgi:hypothetical protein
LRYKRLVVTVMDKNNFTRDSFLGVANLGLKGVGYVPKTIKLHTAVNDTTAGDSVRMTVSSNGNVGINTASPAAKLDVNGGAIFRVATTNVGPLYVLGGGNVLTNALAFDASGLAALYTSPGVSSQTVDNAGPVSITNVFTGTNSYWWTLTSTGTVTMVYSGWLAGRSCYMDVSVYATGLPTVVHATGISTYRNGGYSTNAPTLAAYWGASIRRTPQTYVQIVDTNSVPPGTPQ